MPEAMKCTGNEPALILQGQQAASGSSLQGARVACQASIDASQAQAGRVLQVREASVRADSAQAEQAGTAHMSCA